MNTIQVLNGMQEPSLSTDLLMREAKEEVNHVGEVQFQHVYREANRVADGLANMGIECANFTIWKGDLPQAIHQLVITYQ